MNKSVTAILLSSVSIVALHATEAPTGPANQSRPAIAHSITATSQPSPQNANSTSAASGEDAQAVDQKKKNTDPASSIKSGVADNGPSQEKLDGITALLDSSGASGAVGLNEKLLVQVRTASRHPIDQLDATKYALFFNDEEVKGLPDPTYDKAHQSLVFELKRGDKNKALWGALLGAPRLSESTREVTVGLGERPSDAKSAPQPTITGITKGSDTLNLRVFGPYRLVFAALLIGGVIWLVFARAGKSTTLRDGLVPQIPPEKQTYSLARCQMAFWFVLIFCSFILLYIVTWDYNTVSQQALTLMGISGATALAAAAVDVAKDSPGDSVNRGLQALGFVSYDDVKRTREDEIPNRQVEVAQKEKLLATLPAPPPGELPPQLTKEQRQWVVINQQVTQLKVEINDRENRLRTYEDQIRPFMTQGFFKDVTTDLNGTAIHRLQVFCWTLVLGGIFIIGVYRDLSMPEFSATLLALMGISSAGYVGFKFPEKNN
jgi:hypothetical protein